MEPLVSIIIPVYNVEDWLAETLECVRRQTYNNIEVFLIDDESTDGSGTICDEFAANDDRFQVFHLKKVGISNARNFGLDRVTGKYVMFIDADDLVKPDYVYSLLSVAEKTGRSIITCSYVNGKRCSPDEFLANTDENEPEYELIALQNYMPFNNYTHYEVWAAIFLAQLIEDIRFSPNLSVGEDTLFFYQSLRNAGEAVFVNTEPYYYRFRELSAFHNPFSKARLMRVAVVEKVADIFKGIPGNSSREFQAKAGIICKNDLIKAIECNFDDRKIKNYLYKKAWRYYRSILQSKKIKLITKIAYSAFLCSPILYVKTKRLIKNGK